MSTINNQFDESGKISDAEVQQVLQRLKSDADAQAAQRVIDELLNSTDASVKRLIELQAQGEGEAAADTVSTVESLLRLQSDAPAVQLLLVDFQRQLLARLSSVTEGGATVEYTDQDIDSFVKCSMSADERGKFVAQLRTDTDLCKRCILWRENLSELDVQINAEAAEAFNDGFSQLYDGNRNFPGHQWNSYGQRANESTFVSAREALYAEAQESFEKLLELGELEDLALANLAIVETNMRNAPIAAEFYPGAGYDHGDAMVRAVNEGKMTPEEAVFGKKQTPSDSAGNVPPSRREGIPLRMHPDDRPVEELLTLDISNPNCARQLIRRLNEFIPQERGFLSSFNFLKPLIHDQELRDLMEQHPELVDGLAKFIEEPLPGGNDRQLSNLNDSRQVAYRLLAMRFVQTGDTELLQRIKDLFNKGLDSFRNRGGGDWETNWFHEGPEIIIHYADERDELWAIISEVIEEASKTGMKEYFVNSLRLFRFTESMAGLTKRFEADASARQLVEEKIIKCGDDKAAGDGVYVLKAFPETERVPACLRCLDGTNKQGDFGRSRAISHLQEIDSERLAELDPKIASSLSRLVEEEVALRLKDSKKSRGKESIDEMFSRHDQQRSQAAHLIKMSMLVHSIDQTEGEKSICSVLENFIKTGNCGEPEGMVVFAEYCREHSIAATRNQFVTLYPHNIHSDCNACHSRDYLALLREWNVTDRELAATFLSAGALGGAYDQLIKSFSEEEEVTGYRGKEYKGINNGKDPQDWLDVVEQGADSGDVKFIELLLQEPYRHLLTPQRIQGVFDSYIQMVSKENSRWEEHSDEKTNRYHEALAACAHIPETRSHLLASVENEMRKFESPEAIAADERSPRLLHFLMQLHNRAMAVEVNERAGEVSPQVRSWLFFSRDFQPPAEVSQLVFDYCLNDKTRASVDVTSSFDDCDQMEAVKYVDTIFNLVGRRGDEDEAEEAPISLQDLETYVNNLVVGRKIPVAALQAAYSFQLPHIAWGKAGGGGRSGKSASEILKLMKYPILGITSGGMNHRGPTMQGLQSRFSNLYSHLQHSLGSLEFGQEEGTDPDLEVAFFMSAAFRLRNYQAATLLRNHPLEDRDLYVNVARFASMGAAEAEEDQDYEVALEMLQVLQEVIEKVPDEAELEAMTKPDFQFMVSHKIEQIGVKVDEIKSERVVRKVKENPEIADKFKEQVRDAILLIREGVSEQDAQDYNMYAIRMSILEIEERKMMHRNLREMMRMHENRPQISQDDRERFERVRRYNEIVRLMRASLNAKVINKTPSEGGSFGSWSGGAVKVLGYETCQSIGEQICKEMNFTIDELD